MAGEESLRNQIDQAKSALNDARRILEKTDLEDGPSLLEQARSAMAQLEKVEQLLGNHARVSSRRAGASGRILAYFQEKGLEVPVGRDELRRISGIQEWARRVRELRVEQGWDIRYDGSSYRLMADRPDEAVANTWRLANSIRNKSLSARERILEYFKARVGEVVDSEQLNYISGIQEHGRRIRELRNELGYSISSQIDRPELRPGEYVLETLEPTLNVSERKVSETLRKTVLERDGYRCVLCGRQYGSDVLLSVRRLVLEIDDELDTDPENFVTLCREDQATITDEQRQALQRRRRRRRSDIGDAH